MLSLLERGGFAVIPGALSAAAVDSLLRELEQELSAENVASSRRGDSVYAVRNILSVSRAARKTARSPEVRRLVEPVLGTGCVAVRGILFDKTPGANWNVAWHQDLSLAVRQRHDLPGWGPWSVKAGVVHVQPPAVLLEKMLTIRLHLDPCGEENGPLRVLPGTQARGRIRPARIAELRQTISEEVCIVGRGGALVMRPLLLHTSSDAIVPGHRRVLHLEFASEALPNPLEWNEEIGVIVEDACGTA